MPTGFQLYYGPGVRQEASRLFNECKERYREEKGHTFVYVVPTHRYARELSRELILDNPRNWQSPPVYPLRAFIKNLLPRKYSYTTVLSDVESIQVLRHLILEKPERFSTFISPGGTPFPNLIARAAGAIFELKIGGIDPIQKENIPISIQPLFSEYKNFFQKNSLFDEADILRLAVNHLSEQTLQERFPGLEVLIVDGMDFFPGLLLEFLKKQLERGAWMT